MRSLIPWPVFPSNLDAPVARSLSIQFILQALIDAFAIVPELQRSLPLQLKGINLKEEIELMIKELEKIYLFSMENPFSQKGGILDKLCFYSEILAQSSQIKDAELTDVMEEMRRSISLAKSKMMAWKKPSRYPLEKMVEQLMELLAGVLQSLSHFFKALNPFLKEARTDENVLIYLLENKEKLNRHLGPRYIEDLLQSFFPAGFDQLRAVIYEGYTRRGFTSFLSSMEPLIESVQWEQS